MSTKAKKLADQITTEMVERIGQHWEEYKRGDGPPLDELEVAFLQKVQQQGTADEEVHVQSRFLQNLSQDELDALWTHVRSSMN